MKNSKLTRHLPQLAALIVALGIASLHAAPVGPAYPPPGGVTFSGAGNIGAASGRTNFYTAMDPTAYGELYWTFATIKNPRHSSQAVTGDMNFSSYNASTGISTWTSSANMIWSTAFGTQNIATRLLIQFQPYTGSNSGPLGSGWMVPVTASSVSIGSLSANWRLADVAALTDPTDDFQVWYRYETAAGAPLLTYYDSSNSLGGSAVTSASGGFYSTAPEPSTGLLLGLGAGALLLRRRRVARA